MSVHLKSLLGVQTGGPQSANSRPWGAAAAPKSSAKSLKEIQEEQRRQEEERARNAPAMEPVALQQASAAGPGLAGTWSQPKQRPGGPSLRDIMGEQAQAAARQQQQQPKMAYAPRPAMANSWAAKAAGPSYNPSPVRLADPRATPAAPAQAKAPTPAAVSRPEDEVDMFWNFQDTKAAPSPAAAAQTAPARSGRATESAAKKPQSEVSDRLSNMGLWLFPLADASFVTLWLWSVWCGVVWCGLVWCDE